LWPRLLARTRHRVGMWQSRFPRLLLSNMLLCLLPGLLMWGHLLAQSRHSLYMLQMRSSRLLSLSMLLLLL
jgi:hypothetical protein